MALTRGFVQNAVMTPLDARLMNMAQTVCNADGSPRTGVLGNANTSIVSTTGSMTVNVAAAEFAVSKGKADGVVLFTNDGTTAVAIGAAPGSNSRIDVIWVRHQDSTTGDGASTPIFGVTAGTAAASPVKPSIPTGAEELATLRVYAGTVATNGGSNVLTNTYRMTSTRGGVVTFRTKADMDAWTTACIGQLATVHAEAATANTYRFTGAAWVLPTPPVLGSLSVTPASQGGLSSETAVTSASLGVTVPRTGRVKITVNVVTYATTNDVVIALRIKDGGTTVIDANRTANSSPSAPGTSHYQSITAYVNMTAGAHTIALFVVRAAGTGTFTIAPGANNPTQIIVEMLD